MPHDFLPSFRPDSLRQGGGGASRPQADAGEFWFRFTAGAEGTAPRLLTVDATGRVVDPDPRYCRGEAASILRTIHAIEDEDRFNISWGLPEEKGIDLKAHPYLLYQLVRCPNLQDPSGRPLTVSERPATLVLSITRPAEDAEDRRLVPAWMLRLPSTDDGESVMTADFFAVSDSWVISGDTLYPTAGSIGRGFADLPFFASPFTEDMLEQYLSVVYSYVENFVLDYGAYSVEMSPEEVAPRPTLVFEKVDPDMALHLRVTSSVRGVDAD
ncbi:MAG: hypothetical protein K2H87_03990, partial [Duncaniella sp.]|nr:hypothetical protein [Duncaniella sp.]